MHGLCGTNEPKSQWESGWLASQIPHCDLAGIIVLLFVFEQMDSDCQHFAHHRYQGGAFLETALYQSAIVGTKGGTLQMNAAQGRQIEHLSQQPAAAFGEFSLTLPQATFFDL